MQIDSVYIHIPFCFSICSYCDFCKVIYKSNWAKKYLVSLKDEIKDRYMGDIIKTIYIGGGTPSVLSLDELEYLLKLTKYFKIDKNYEFTFECNIDDITEEKIDLLIKYGVNRLSIGIESFDENNLLLMKRNANFKDTENKINMIRRKGINNINLDLIYALPNESLQVLKSDIKQFIKLNPEHISTYSLILEDNTFLKYQKIEAVSEDTDSKMYEYIRKTLKKYDYYHYEISNFSKKGYESKHNLTYWDNLEYYGFGASAAGYIHGIRYENTKNLTKYISGDYKSTESIIDKNAKMEYELMLGLRKTIGINIYSFNNKYGVNIYDVFPIKPLLKNKDLILKGDNLMINPEKLYVMNEILLKLL